MSRPRSVSPPSYRRHRQSGQAVVTLSDPSGRRKDYLLGPFGSAESKREYARLIAEWTAAGWCIPHAGPAPADLTVNELLVRFWSHVTAYYRHADGSPTSEVDNYRLSLRPLKQLYGHTAAKDFGPLALKAVRGSMIDAALSRKLINQRVGRIRRAFKWAVGEQLVPATAFHALQAVDGLGAGRSAAVEAPPVSPVADTHVAAVLSSVNRHVAGMIRFQRLTGCRPQDVCNLRRCDIDTSGPVWFYRPPKHKTAHTGRERVVTIGPKAQAVLTEFPTEHPAAYVFSPARMTAERLKILRATRTTAIQPSQVCRAKCRPRKKPGEKYTTRSYHQAVRKACERAGIDGWHPNQLRHTRGTEVRKAYGLEAAQVVLGHTQAKVTEVYAESDATLAARVALETG
jgi:integrase